MKLVMLLTTVAILGIAMENNATKKNLKEMYTEESVAGAYSSGNNSGQLVESYLLHDNTFCLAISSMDDVSYIAGNWSQNGDKILFNEIRKPSPAFYMTSKQDNEKNESNIKMIDFYGYSLANALTVLYGVSSDGKPPKEMRRIVERGQTTFSSYYSLPFDENASTTIFFAVQIDNPDYKNNTMPVYFEQFQINDVNANHFIVSIDTKALEKPFIAEGEFSDNTIIFKNDYKGLVVRKSNETMRMDELYSEIKSDCIDPVLQKNSLKKKNQILPINNFEMKIQIPRLDNPYYKEENSPNGRIIFNS
jgi:hypothetical protein